MSQFITSARLKPSEDKQERQAKQRKMLSDAVSGLKTIAGIAQDVTKVVDPGLPGLQPVLTGLIYALDAIQVSDHIHTDSPPNFRQRQLRKIYRISNNYWRESSNWWRILRNTSKEPVLPQSLKDWSAFQGKSSPVFKYMICINKLSRSFDEITRELREIANRHPIKRFLGHSNDASAISNIIQEITWKFQSLTVGV